MNMPNLVCTYRTFSSCMSTSINIIVMFRAPKAKFRRFLANFRDFRRKIGVFRASAGGASENFGVILLDKKSQKL